MDLESTGVNIYNVQHTSMGHAKIFVRAISKINFLCHF